MNWNKQKWIFKPLRINFSLIYFLSSFTLPLCHIHLPHNEVLQEVERKNEKKKFYLKHKQANHNIFSTAWIIVIFVSVYFA